MRKVQRKIDPKLEKMTTQQRAKSKVRTRGFELPTRPAGEFPELQVEEDFSTWSDAEVIHQMAVFARWAEFASTEMAMAETIEDRAERIFRRVRDETMISQPSGTVTAAKAIAGLSDAVIEAEEELASAKAYRRLVQSLLSNLDRSQSVLSRELTRRVGREGPERRDARWGRG